MAIFRVASQNTARLVRDTPVKKIGEYIQIGKQIDGLLRSDVKTTGHDT